MAFLLGAEQATVEMPTKVVLDKVSLGINTGDRIGIVGRNGDGKSTLLRMLDGKLIPDSGRIIKTSGTTVGFLGQDDGFSDDETVGHAVVGDRPEYEWASNPKIRNIIAGLLGDIAWDARISELSGGQRRRVDLARVLANDWDIVMLDEPTNHLDMKTIVWLAGHLKTRWRKDQGALVVVTHDRWFLDEVCTTMWEVHDGKVDIFEGGFSAYIMQRVERDRLAAVAEQRRQSKLRRELAWLSRGARARATKPKFHVALARELIADVPELRNPPELKRMAMARIGKDVVELQDMSFSYPTAGDGCGDKVRDGAGNGTGNGKSGDGESDGRISFDRDGLGQRASDHEPNLHKPQNLFERVNWIIGPGDRIGIVGGNGAGKTTLLNLIQGALRPTSGRVKIGSTVKFAMLSQRLENLSELADRRVREIVSNYPYRRMASGKEMTPSQLLEDLGFSSGELNEFVRDLSGGQRRRLALMMILMEESNVLILDEPGNDLDVDMLAALEDLLDDWPGTLIVVTHDRNLMERTTDDQYAICDRGLRHLPGGIDEYLRLVNDDNARSEGRPGKPAGDTDAGTRSRPEGKGGAGNAPDGVPSEEGRQAGNKQNGDDADRPLLSNAERQRLKKLIASNEKKISTLEGKINAATELLGSIDPTDFKALMDKQAEIDELNERKDSLEIEWLEATEALGE